MIIKVELIIRPARFFWTRFNTDDTCAEQWVYWNFTYTPPQAGTYVIYVRAIAEDGTVSSVPASHTFRIT